MHPVDVSTDGNALDRNDYNIEWLEVINDNVHGNDDGFMYLLGEVVVNQLCINDEVGIVKKKKLFLEPTYYNYFWIVSGIK